MAPQIMAFVFSVGFCDLRFEKAYQKTAPAPEAMLCLTYFRKSTVLTSTAPEYIFPSPSPTSSFMQCFSPNM